jgi:hypothetical protein
MHRHSAVRWGIAFVVIVFMATTGGRGGAWAQAPNPEIEALRKEIEEMRRREAEHQKQLEELQRRLEGLQAQPVPAKPSEAPVSPLDRALQQLGAPQPPSQAPVQPQPAQPQPAQPPPPQPALLARQVGRATLRLIDISGDLLAAAGGSTANDDTLEVLQGGDHDPNRNGFTLQQMELSLGGAVDPYFTAESHIIFVVDREGETRVELEEAFATTQSLPFGLQVKAGFFFTEFGLLNPVHPHAWDWIDQPVVLSRFFGGDGLRQAGLRVSWLTPLPWFSLFYVGVQNANGETAVSFLANDEVFEERPIGGRPFVERGVDGPEDLLYLLRWENSWDLSPGWTSKLGFSALFGPNATGSDGRTIIYGADLKVVWRPERNFRGWPFLRWQSEFLRREYTAAAFTGELDETPVVFAKDTLHDWGVYTQALYGFAYRWAGGLRFEYASGSGASVSAGGRDADPFRDDRVRVSPLLIWYASEFARLRLQYNYDWADHLSDDGVHSVWLGIEALFGTHPAHKF